MNLIRTSVVAKIIAVILIACILPSGLLLYFYSKRTSQDLNVMIEDSLSKLAEEKAQVVSLMMSRIESESLSVSLWIEENIAASETRDASLPPGYEFDSDGTLGRIKSGDDISSVYFPAGMAIPDRALRQLQASDSLDGIFSAHLNGDSNISTIYYITREGLMRVFPYLDNEVFTVGHDQRTDLFYTVASGDNLEEDFVWTRPYYDYAGQGWVMTCSRPLFVDDSFVGVLCLDMPLYHLKKVFSDFRIGDNGFAFIIDADGNAIYHPDYISLTSKKGEALPVNLLTASTLDDFKSIVREMMEGNQGIGTYRDTLSNSSWVVAYQPVPGTSFSIAVQADQLSYATLLGGSPNETILLGLLIILSILVAGIILSYLIARPITSLSHDVEAITAGAYGGEVRIASKDEIGSLAKSFNTMSVTIQKNMGDILERTIQLETILDSIDGLLFIVDKEFRLQLMNSRGKAILADHGFPPGAKCHEIFGSGKSPCMNCPVEQALTTQGDSFGEIAIGGEVFHSFAYPVHNAEDSISQIVVYSRKVTDQILLDREIRQTEKLAGIGNLATAVTHELKNPLAVMKGALYLLPDAIKSNEPAEAEEILLSLKDSLERAEKIVFGLLNFSRKSSGKPEPVNLPVLLDQILLLEREAIVRNKIRVLRRYQHLDSDVHCEADSLKHVFLNLISNAVKAMPQGGELTLSANKVITGSGKAVFRFEVSDTGMGIREPFLDQIFLPFATEGPDGQGTGMGLWIVQREISRMGGTIRVESKLGKGTTFYIELPENDHPC